MPERCADTLTRVKTFEAHVGRPSCRSPIPPGHAQVDFGEAVATIGFVQRKVYFFCINLPLSDACFVRAYPRETTEAFLDWHVAAFFDGVPLSILTHHVSILSLNGDSYRLRSFRSRRGRADGRAEQNQASADTHDPGTGAIAPT